MSQYFSVCYNKITSLQNPYIEALPPYVMVFGDEVFKELIKVK
jgi:hypothetical protein